MYYSHWSFVRWSTRRWPNFTAEELACPCCDRYYHDPIAVTMLQRARRILGKPMSINSAHRCFRHNIKVGGRPLSMHKRIAFDISTHGHDRRELLDALRRAGFTTFGFYGTFIHVDRRPYRRWATKRGRQVWKDLMSF